MNKDIKTYLQRVDAKKEEMAARVMQWSNINTGSFNVPGLERLAAVLTQAFSVLDCEGNVLSLPPIEQVDGVGVTQKVDLGPMLRFWKRADAPNQILLVGHMDTVYELEHPFQRSIRKSDTIINGPGVTDMKGGLCIMLEALTLFEQSDIAKNLGWEVIINPDEEIGSLGSASFLEERAKAHKIGLLFEPAMDEHGTLVGARKGSGRFTLIMHGKAAHSGREHHLGRNAIVALAHMVTKIDALNGKKEGVTLNVGHIQGGGAINVVPDLAICRFDVRIQQAEDAQWVQEQLEKIMSSVNQQEGYKVELKGKFHRKPKILTVKTEALYQVVAEVGKELQQSITWKQSGGCSDGNNLAEVGLPNVDTLGVCGGKIHSSEEYLLVDSLVSRTKLTAGMLFKLNESKNPFL